MASAAINSPSIHSMAVSIDASQTWEITQKSSPEPVDSLALLELIKGNRVTITKYFPQGPTTEVQASPLPNCIDITFEEPLVLALNTPQLLAMLKPESTTWLPGLGQFFSNLLPKALKIPTQLQEKHFCNDRGFAVPISALRFTGENGLKLHLSFYFKQPLRWDFHLILSKIMSFKADPEGQRIYTYEHTFYPEMQQASGPLVHQETPLKKINDVLDEIEEKIINVPYEKQNGLFEEDKKIANGYVLLKAKEKAKEFLEGKGFQLKVGKLDLDDDLPPSTPLESTIDAPKPAPSTWSIVWDHLKGSVILLFWQLPKNLGKLACELVLCLLRFVDSLLHVSEMIKTFYAPEPQDHHLGNV